MVVVHWCYDLLLYVFVLVIWSYWTIPLKFECRKGYSQLILLTIFQKLIKINRHFQSLRMEEDRVVHVLPAENLTCVVISEFSDLKDIYVTLFVDVFWKSIWFVTIFCILGHLGGNIANFLLLWWWIQTRNPQLKIEITKEVYNIKMFQIWILWFELNVVWVQQSIKPIDRFWISSCIIPRQRQSFLIIRWYDSFQIQFFLIKIRVYRCVYKKWINVHEESNEQEQNGRQEHADLKLWTVAINILWVELRSGYWRIAEFFIESVQKPFWLLLDLYGIIHELRVSILVIKGPQCHLKSLCFLNIAEKSFIIFRDFCLKFYGASYFTLDRVTFKWIRLPVEYIGILSHIHWLNEIIMLNTYIPHKRDRHRWYA